MGLNFLASSSSFDCKCNNKPMIVQNTVLPVLNVNPDPNNYIILRFKTIHDYLVIELRYTDCSNYEGRKIMVFNCDLQSLQKQKQIDPHFSNNKKYHSPIARFEPTDTGWDDAVVYARFKAAKDGG